jgi:hypothetical protein
MRAQTQFPVGRICEGDGCSRVLSVYNDDDICARCYAATPLEHLPTTMGRFL